MECHCYLRNVQDLLADGKTTHEWRFGKPFNGPVMPFGAMVEHRTISANDQSRLHQFDAKILSGIVFGYALIAEESGQEIFWLQTLRSWKNRSKTNVIAERAVRRIKEGTSDVLLQSGLDEKVVGWVNLVPPKWSNLAWRKLM